MWIFIQIGKKIKCVQVVRVFVEKISKTQFSDPLCKENFKIITYSDSPSADGPSWEFSSKSVKKEKVKAKTVLAQT